MKTSQMYFMISQMWLMTSFISPDVFTKFGAIIMGFVFIRMSMDDRE